MADRHHFEKPLNRHSSAMVRKLAVKFSMLTHFDPFKPSDGQILSLLKSKMADGRCPDKSVVDILKATVQGTEPLRCGCWWGCILTPPGEYRPFAAVIGLICQITLPSCLHFVSNINYKVVVIADLATEKFLLPSKTDLVSNADVV